MDPIPDFSKLINTVLHKATHRESLLHGESHWKCVAWSGLELCEHLTTPDPLVVFLFGLLHDSKRLNDGHDPDHGRRAGALVRQLQGNAFHLSELQCQTLVRACNEHTDGMICPENPTIGACWDADRLNLWRVGIEPSPRFMSTAPAKQPDRIRRSSAMVGQGHSWEKIADRISIISAAAPVPQQPPGSAD